MQNIEEIYKQHSNAVYKYLFCLTGNADISEEFTQETFAIAVKEITKSVYANLGKAFLMFITSDLYDSNKEYYILRDKFDKFFIRYWNKTEPMIYYIQINNLFKTRTKIENVWREKKMPNWTKEQKQAIYEKNSNLLVAAAAGSRKNSGISRKNNK